MIITEKIKLSVDKNSLRDTVVRANEACGWIAKRAFEERTFRQYGLHALAYNEARAAFPDLASQVIVRCIAKVAAAYALRKSRKAAVRFRPTGAIELDARLLSWKESGVSLWTVNGRKKMKTIATPARRERLAARKGSAKLYLGRRSAFLLVPCEVPEEPAINATRFLGVDLGIVNLAADSDGNVYSGKVVDRVRERDAKLRAALQSCGSRSAKRHLQRLGSKRSRFQRDVNHVISKRLVSLAKGTGRGIALEDLSGIRDRVTASRTQRARLSNWAFFQLRSFVDYKAKRGGVPVLVLDPTNSSRECSACGSIAKANRRARDAFACRSCGHREPADTNAAKNLSHRAALLVNQPIVADGFQPSSCKPPALAGGS